MTSATMVRPGFMSHRPARSASAIRGPRYSSLDGPSPRDGSSKPRSSPQERSQPHRQFSRASRRHRRRGLLLRRACVCRVLDKTEPMAERERAWMSWSSGKDSTMALDVVRSQGVVEVKALLCTVNADADRVAMQAVRRSLLEAQSDRLGLPLVIVDIPSPCPPETYEALMAEAVEQARAEGVALVFGDLFLPDVRAYREERWRGRGYPPCSPFGGARRQYWPRRCWRAG